MADIVGGDTISELMNAFSKFDTDKDGLIGTPELKNVLRFLGHNPTDAELQELAYAMDTNESGTIDLPEFLQAMAKSKADEDAEEDIREAFKVSKTGNGRLIFRKVFLCYCANITNSLHNKHIPFRYLIRMEMVSSHPKSCAL